MKKKQKSFSKEEILSNIRILEELRKTYEENPTKELKVQIDALKKTIDTSINGYKKNNPNQFKKSENEEGFESSNKGDIVDGTKYAGDRVDAKINSGEMVLNLEQQQRLLELLKGKRELKDLGNEDIIKSKYADGGVPAIDEVIAPEVNPPLTPPPTQTKIPYAPPVALTATTNTAPLVQTGALLPESMRYTGPGSTPMPSEPVQLPANIAQTPAPVEDSEAQAAAAAQRLANAQMEKEVAIKSIPTDKDIEKAAEPIKKGRAAAVAQLQQEQAALTEEQRKAEEIRKRLEEENKKYENEPIKNLFQTASTGQKIMAGIAIALGSLGAAMTGGKNYALEIINKAIDTDLETQKLKRSDALAKKEAAYKQIELNLKKREADTNDKLVKAKISEINNSIMTESAKVAAERLLLKQREGMSTGNIDPSLLTKEEKAVSIIDPTTNKRYFVTAGDDKTAQKIRDYQNEIYPALGSISRIKELGKEGRAVFWSKRASEIETEKAALIGNLRLPITGPGVLTKEERTLLDEIIGGKIDIFSFSDNQKARLNTIENKLREAMNITYKTAGINIELTPRDKLIQKVMKEENKTYDQASRNIDTLIEKGSLSKEKYER